MIYSELTKTYLIKNKILDVEVGDSKQAEFLPRVKLKKWDNEVNLSVGLIDDGAVGLAKVTESAGVINWRKNDIEAHFYERPALAIDDGSFEFEVIFNRRPAGNILELSTNIPKGLKFFYQGPLTPEEIAEGCERPEEIVGSYAVYHDSKTGGEKYKTGKAFHIYRPKIIDAAGAWTWGELEIKPEAQRLFITIPDDFLDKAVYPVTVDPTFGYTSIGATSASTVNVLGGCKFASPGASQTSSITIYTRKNTSDFQLAAAVYSDNSGAPNAKLAEDGGNVSVTSTMPDWYTVNIVCSLNASTDYWLTRWFSGTAYYYYDTGSTGQHFHRQGDTFETWPDPVGSVNYLGRIASYYATYTDGYPQTITPTGIASTAAIGAPTMVPGGVTLALSGIAPTTAIGTPSVFNSSFPQDLVLTGIAPTAAFGTVNFIQIMELTGIASTAVLGTPEIRSIEPGGPMTRRRAVVEVRVYNSSLALVAIAEDYLSLTYKRRWQRGSEFNLYISKYSEAMTYLVDGNFIHVLRDGVAEFTGIIEHGEIKLDEQGKASEVWQFKGGGVLSRRIALPPQGQSHDEQSGPAETVLKTYVTNNAVNPTDTNRAISVLSVEADSARGATVTMRARYNKLVDLLEETAIAGGIGWEVVKSGSGLQFKVVPGTDRSTDQAIVPPIIFSPDYGNIRSLGYLWSKLSHANFSYVAGQGEGIDRTLVTVPTSSIPTGLSRREMFVDARDLDAEAKLPQRGQAKLDELGPEERFEAQILEGSPFAYRADWDLGDIVTVRNPDWGILAHLRVAEVTVTLEPSTGEQITVAFGAPWPNFLQHIKRSVDGPGPAMRV